MGSGSSAGGQRTSPVRRSNSDAWHGQTITRPSSSPSASEHSSWVQVSWNATQPSAVRPRQTAAPSTSTRRRKPTLCSSAAPTLCQVSSLTGLSLERGGLSRGLESECLVERGDATVLGRVRGGVVDPVTPHQDDDQEPDQGNDDEADR